MRSIEAASTGLQAAVSERDWQLAHRHIERLKAIALDGVARNDPLAIKTVGLALQSCGQHIELGGRLNMEMDALALAWQLRADVSTAVLAQRIRPVAPLSAMIDEDVANQLLRTLTESNAPMSNGQLAERMGKDPATISRTLKRLKSAGKISQWRSGRHVYNAARSKLRQHPNENDFDFRMLTRGSRPNADSNLTNTIHGDESMVTGFRNPTSEDVKRQLVAGIPA